MSESKRGHCGEDKMLTKIRHTAAQAPKASSSLNFFRQQVLCFKNNFQHLAMFISAFVVYNMKGWQTALVEAPVSQNCMGQYPILANGIRGSYVEVWKRKETKRISFESVFLAFEFLRRNINKYLIFYKWQRAW